MKPKLLFFVTEDWYFYSHRLNLALAAVMEGFDVSVLTRVNDSDRPVLDANIDVINLDIRRGSLNVFRELRTLWAIWKIYRTLKPDILHHVALKPVLYGGLIALFFPKAQVVSLVAGMGSVFSTAKSRGKWLRPVVKLMLRCILRQPNHCVIVQNTDDRQFLVDELDINQGKIFLIKGSGVDTTKFRVKPEVPGHVRVAMVSRLLWDKGIGEFVEAVRYLKAHGLEFTALLVGKPDDANIDSVTQEELKQWQRTGLLECTGFISNVAEFWRTNHIAVLPSYYGEGVPKSLIEAAASGRAIVTTDSPGCKEIVKKGVNGILVPPRDFIALADALKQLIIDTELRQKMGVEGRKIVEHEFSDEIVIQKTLNIYRDLMCH